MEFAVRKGLKDAVTEVRSEPIKGPVRVTATLDKDGTRALTIGEQTAVTGKAPELIASQPQEDYCPATTTASPSRTTLKGNRSRGRSRS
jgi:hypothetical protein